MKALIDILKALSSETRLRIINLLYEQELCVCDVMETLQITQAKASRHLIYLKNTGLVKDRKQAQWVYYSIRSDRQFKLLTCLVYDNLRTMEICQKDIERLHQWLKQKKDICKY